MRCHKMLEEATNFSKQLSQCEAQILTLKKVNPLPPLPPGPLVCFIVSAVLTRRFACALAAIPSQVSNHSLLKVAQVNFTNLLRMHAGCERHAHRIREGTGAAAP